MFLNNCLNIPQELTKFARIFNDNNYKCYLVGGAVRDMIMGIKAHDYDIATDARPEDVMRIFKKVIPTGIAHGTVTVHIFGMEIETTTFRTESDYSDGRHPDRIEFAGTIEEDLSRRDFTMNAIAYDILNRKIVDPFEGQKDIKNKTIRTVGNAVERFTEDGLRPVRALRFASQLGFQIEDETFKSISEPAVLEKTRGISPERFRDEFCKIMSTDKPSVGLKLLEQTGILSMFIPEFTPCRNCIQKDIRGFHEFDVADHNLYACDGAPKDNLIVRLAAFFHDIGKPEARATETVDGNEVVHFHGHETISEKKTIRAMTNLKFSNDEIKKVSHLVKEHMFHYESSWSNAAVRRFIIRIGTENLDDLILVRLADTHGMHNTPVAEGSPTWKNIVELKKRIEAVLNEKSALSLKDLKVNGNDLMKEGIPAGIELGMILKELFETVTDSPEMNEREKLIFLARNIHETKFRN